MAVGSISIIAIPVPLPTPAGLQDDMAVLGMQKDMICIGRVQCPDPGPLAALDHLRQNLDQYHPLGKAEAHDAASGAALAIAATAVAVIEVAARVEIGVKVAIKTNDLRTREKHSTSGEGCFFRRVSVSAPGSLAITTYEKDTNNQGFGYCILLVRKKPKVLVQIR